MTKEQKFYSALKDIFVGADEVRFENGEKIPLISFDKGGNEGGLDYRLIKSLIWW